MGAAAADRMDAVVQSRQQDRGAVDMAGEHAGGRDAGQRHAPGEVWTGRRGVGVGHGATPVRVVPGQVAV